MLLLRPSARTLELTLDEDPPGRGLRHRRLVAVLPGDEALAVLDALDDAVEVGRAVSRVFVALERLDHGLADERRLGLLRWARMVLKRCSSWLYAQAHCAAKK